MWHVQIPTTTTPPNTTTELPGPNILQHAAQSAIAAETQRERIAFQHAYAGSQAISTLCHAIDAWYYTTWPNLQSAKLRQHLKAPTATVQGRLDQ